ncbi:MAG: SpoIIE family protein phosphatase, partial [Bacteroidia bacterium]
MKKIFFLILSIIFVLSIDAQTLQDTLKNLPHVHSPIFSGSGDESIVCYKSSHRNTFFAITGLIVALAIVLFKLYVFNRKTTHKLQKQKQIIEEKNKDITDSINYARRLQNAILPPIEQVNAIMPEHFILYQPKDIVSGDFYWISDLDDDVFIAAIDCTGHGIPGALLSIIGHNAINKSINELKIRKPADIMDSMNNTIKKVLHQDEGSNLRDGMDMALCNLNRKTGALEYAGANNNLYIISDKKLTIVKASKLTVGTV